MSRLDVTVAICTFNRAALLEKTLLSMTALRAPADLTWELLVVDNRCTDRTRDVCARFADRLPIRVLAEDVAGLSNARNRALGAAMGGHIIFTDDDVLLDEDWLSAFVAATRRWPNAAAFGGPIAPLFPLEPDPDLLLAFPVLANGFCGLDYGRDEGPLPPEALVFGANMAYRLDAIAGLIFDPHLGHTGGVPLGGEDAQFVRRVRQQGGELIWCPGMRLKHYVEPSRMTLEYLLLYHRAAGARAVRMAGTPVAPTLFGAPRWLWCAYVETYLKYAACRLAGRRRPALERLRDHSYYGGALGALRHLQARSA